MATPTSTVELKVDKIILSSLRKEIPHLVIVGYFRGGLSSTKARIEARKSEFKNYYIENIPLSADTTDVKRRIGEAQKQSKFLVFLHDYWEALATAKEKPDWIKEDVLENLKELFSQRRPIKHIVNKKDALKILEIGCTANGISLSEIPDKTKTTILKISYFGETHIPALIQETVNLWIEKHPTTIVLLKNQTDVSREAIRNEFKLWEAHLQRRLKQREETMALLGVGAAAGFAGTSIDLVKSATEKIAKLVVPAFELISFPVAALLFIGAAFTLAAERKRGLKESVNTEFKKYSESFLKAQTYWNEHLTETEKELICYDLDKSFCRQLGTAKKDLDSHFCPNGQVQLMANAIELKLTDEIMKQVNAELERILPCIEGMLMWLSDLESRVQEEHESRIKDSAQIQGRLDHIESFAGVMGTPVELKPMDLHEVPQFGAYRKRPPFMSSSIQGITSAAIKALLKGKKVAILGEAAIGKTTILYMICRSLLVDGHRLFSGGVNGLHLGDIFFIDDIDSDKARSLAKNTPNAIIATCRTENWDPAETGWNVLRLTRNNFSEEILRDILTDCLDSEAVASTNEGLNEALTRCQGHPGYLIELVRSCRTSGLNLTRELAKKAPTESIDLIKKTILSVKNEDALKLLFALALTGKMRLHKIHLETLLRRVDEEPDSTLQLPNEFLALAVVSEDLVFSLPHDLWRDVLLKPWGTLGSLEVDEPYSLKCLRGESLIQDKLKVAFINSIPALLKLYGFAAAAAARVAIENQPEVFNKIHESVIDSESKEHLANVLEQLATINPDAVKGLFKRLMKRDSEHADGNILFLLQWGETLGFKSDRYFIWPSSDGGKPFLVPALPIEDFFIAPSYQGLLLEEALDIVSENADVQIENEHFYKAKLYEDLGTVKAILGNHIESLQALRLAVNEWRLVCCLEKRVLEGCVKKFHDALDKLGAELLIAEEDREALLCLRFAVLSVQLMKRGWLIAFNATNGTMNEKDVKITPSVAEELKNLAAIFQQMGENAWSREANKPLELLPDPNMDLIGRPTDEAKALASSLKLLADAHKRNGEKNKAACASLAAFNIKNVLCRQYEQKGDFSALADELVEISQYIVFDQKIQCLNRAIEIYRKLATYEDSFLPKIADALHKLGGTYYSSNPKEFTQVLSCWGEAEELYRNLLSIHPRFIVDHAIVAMDLANAFLDRKDVRSSIKYFLSAKNSLTDSGSSTKHLWLMARITLGLGEAYGLLRDWDKAIQYLREAEVDWSNIGAEDDASLRQRSRGMMGLGIAFFDGKKQSLSAIEPFRKSLDFLKEIKNPNEGVFLEEAVDLDYIGSALAEMGDHAGALASYREANLKLRKIASENQHNTISLATNLLNIAKLEEKGNHEEAEHSLCEAEQICKSLIDSAGTPDEEVAFLFAILARALSYFRHIEDSIIWYNAALKQLQRLTQTDKRFFKPWSQILNEFAQFLQSESKTQSLVQLYQEDSEFLKTLQQSGELTEKVAENLFVTLINLGYWLIQDYNPKEAISVYEEANKILIRLIGVSDAETKKRLVDICSHVAHAGEEAIEIGRKLLSEDKLEEASVFFRIAEEIYHGLAVIDVSYSSMLAKARELLEYHSPRNDSHNNSK